MVASNSHPESSDEYADKQTVVHQLIQESHIGQDYYFLLTISTLLTTIGLIINSTAVVVGGMLIAPLLSPILALGLATVTSNRESLQRSSLILLKSMGIVLGLAFLTAFIVGVDDPENLEIVQRTEPSLLYMYIAILSGVGATYAWAKPKLSASLPGIAVVVALLPPLCVTAIGFSILDREIITGSFQLFLINIIGIAASAAVLFSLMGFHKMRWVEKHEIDAEKKVEEQKKKEKEMNDAAETPGDSVL